MSGLEAETAALRRGAGAFRPARDVLAVRGPEAEAYLQGQLSQDVSALAVGESSDSLLLEPDGKLSALLRVTRTDAQGFVLDVDGGYGDAVLARLRRFVLRSKVEMEPLAWRCLSLRGAAVGEAAAGLLAVLAERGVLALPFEWNGWQGTDLLGPEDVVLGPEEAGLPAGVVPCGPEAVEACRIVSGIPAMGTELTGKTIAAEAGLVERTVSFTKGCYTGQELVARIDSRGSNVARRLVGIVAPGDPPGKDGGAAIAALARGMTLHARRGARRRRRGGRQGGRHHHVGGLERRAGSLGGARVPAPHRRGPRAGEGALGRRPGRVVAGAGRAAAAGRCGRGQLRGRPDRGRAGAPWRLAHCRAARLRRGLCIGGGGDPSVHRAGRSADRPPDRPAGRARRGPLAPAAPSAPGVVGAGAAPSLPGVGGAARRRGGLGAGRVPRPGQPGPAPDAQFHGRRARSPLPPQGAGVLRLALAGAVHRAPGESREGPRALGRAADPAEPADPA